MAEGLASTFVINPALFHTGMYESLARNLQAFNAASNNALVLTNQILIGNYASESFYKLPTGVTRRDTTSTSPASVVDITQDEEKAAKLNRKFGPFQKTEDAWRKIGKAADEMSFVLGQMAGEQILQDQLDAALAAGEAAIQSQASMVLDITGETTKTLTHSALARVMAKLGDVGTRIAAWAIHSKPYYDLVGAAIATNTTNLTDSVVVNGQSPGTFNRPAIVTDAGALTDANGSSTDTYNTLGLVPGAVRVVVSETQVPQFIPVAGQENQVWEFRVEFSYDVFVKGMKFDTSIVNPTVSQLGTHTNWTLAASTAKNGPGVRLVSR